MALGDAWRTGRAVLDDEVDLGPEGGLRPSTRPSGRRGGGRCPPGPGRARSQQRSHEVGVGVEVQLALPLDHAARGEGTAQTTGHRRGVDPVVDLDEDRRDAAAATRRRRTERRRRPRADEQRGSLAAQEPAPRAPCCAAGWARCGSSGEWENTTRSPASRSTTSGVSGHTHSRSLSLPPPRRASRCVRWPPWVLTRSTGPGCSVKVLHGSTSWIALPGAQADR